MTAPPADDTADTREAALAELGAMEQAFLGDMDAALSVILAAEREKENGAVKSPANPGSSSTPDAAGDDTTTDTPSKTLETAVKAAPSTADATDSDSKQRADAAAGTEKAGASDKPSPDGANDSSTTTNAASETSNAADGSGEPTKADSKAVIKVDGDAKDELKKQANKQPIDETKTTKGDAKEQTKAKDDKTDTKTSPKTDTKTDTKGDTKEVVKVEDKDTKVESSDDTKKDTKAATEDDSKADSTADSKLDTKVDAKEDTKVDTKEDSKAESKDEIKDETKSEIKDDTKDDTKKDTKKDTKEPTDESKTPTEDDAEEKTEGATTKPEATKEPVTDNTANVEPTEPGSSNDSVAKASDSASTTTKEVTDDLPKTLDPSIAGVVAGTADGGDAKEVPDTPKENGHVKPPPAPFKFPNAFTAFDGKVLQHVYAIGKLEYLIANLQEAASLPTEGDEYNVILLPIVACFTPGVFYIADGPLSQRVDIVAHYKLFRMSPPPNINDKQFTHIPYDFQDVLVVPLDDLPLELMAQKCLHLYQSLLQQVLAAYKKRLALQSLPPGYIESVSKLVGLRQTDVDCAPAEILRTTLSPNILTDDTAVEALLIDNDLKGVITMCRGVREILSRLNPRIQMYKTLRGQPPPLAVWEVVGLTLRLNDLYTCVRRLGRQVLNANHVHLVDQKFLFQLKNGAYMRHLLLKAEAIFNGNRKNGTLVATLTRVILRHQAPSGYPCDPKLVRDLANFVSQGWFAVDQAVLALDEFVTSWVAAELRFRAAYNLPRQYLSEISKGGGGRRGKPQPRDAKSAAAAANSQATNTTTNATKPSAPVAAAQQSLAPPRLRSSLVLLVALTGLGQTSQAPVRTSRIPPALPLRGSPVPQLDRVDSSQLLNSQNQAASPAPPLTRTRSNSLPVHNPATLGAAAALKVARLNLARRSPAASTVSPTPQRNLTVFAQSSKNVQKQLLAVAEEDGSTRLSAQQRLQQHLRAASKLGALVTQQREPLVPVTFDPANPSEYQLRRERSSSESPVPLGNVPQNPLASSLPPGGIPQGSLNSLPELVLREFGQPTMLGKPTMRDVQTRRNTARNSKVILEDMLEVQFSALLLGLESTRSSAPLTTSAPASQLVLALGEVRKVVRFTGVPEYSEEEDLPANYALKILRNFAVIRPTNQQHQAFRRKESQLKREESIQWRHQLHQGE